MANWRHALSETREGILSQYLYDREVCRKIMIWNGSYIDSANLSWWDLADHADRRARVSVERAIRRDGSSIYL